MIAWRSINSWQQTPQHACECNACECNICKATYPGQTVSVAYTILCPNMLVSRTNIYQPEWRPDAAVDTHGVPSRHMDYCNLGQKQQIESATSGLDKDKQAAAECMLKPSPLQILLANGSRVSSQKKQARLPRQQAMVPGQSMNLVMLL